jgi:hypothetical protein
MEEAARASSGRGPLATPAERRRLHEALAAALAWAPFAADGPGEERALRLALHTQARAHRSASLHFLAAGAVPRPSSEGALMHVLASERRARACLAPDRSRGGARRAGRRHQRAGRSWTGLAGRPLTGRLQRCAWPGSERRGAAPRSGSAGNPLIPPPTLNHPSLHIEDTGTTGSRSSPTPSNVHGSGPPHEMPGTGRSLPTRHRRCTPQSARCATRRWRPCGWRPSARSCCARQRGRCARAPLPSSLALAEAAARVLPCQAVRGSQRQIRRSVLAARPWQLRVDRPSCVGGSVRGCARRSWGAALRAGEQGAERCGA